METAGWPSPFASMPEFRMVPGLPRIPVLLLGALVSVAWSSGPLRTGMAEAGLRAWAVDRTDRTGEVGPSHLVGLSAGYFLNDNISMGLEVATFRLAPAADSLVLDGRVRLYSWPLDRVTPWAELRAGGGFGLEAGNAVRLGAGMGLRWMPAGSWDGWALDLQLVGVERWRQDWAAEYVEEGQPSGRIDWSLARSPWPLPRRGVFGRSSPLSWPVFGVMRLF